MEPPKISTEKDIPEMERLLRNAHGRIHMTRHCDTCQEIARYKKALEEIAANECFCIQINQTAQEALASTALNTHE